MPTKKTTKTKKQAKPGSIGWVVWATPFELAYTSRPVSSRSESRLIIPMTKDGKCQRARVVEEMAKAEFAIIMPLDKLNDLEQADKEGWLACASAALDRLGWPEDKTG